MHVPESLGHAETRWRERPPLIVVEDAADRGTIIQHHLLGFLVGLDDVGLTCLAWRLAQQGLLSSPPFGSHRAFDRPQSPNLAPPLSLGAAVGVEDGLGHIPQAMMGTIAMRDPWTLHGNPADKRLLFLRHPQPHWFAELFGPVPCLRQQLLNLNRRA